MKNKIRDIIIIPFILLLIVLTGSTPTASVSAEEATAISVGKIDYENLTMQIYNNNNSIVYYSTNQTTWLEVEGPYNSTTKSYTIDISWITSTSDFTLYFKGDIIKTIKSVTLPIKNSSIKVKFDKVEGEFIFSDVDEVDSFQWRKATDYNWTTVDLDETSTSYQSFLDTMELLRSKGIKILFRTPQIMGTSINNVGMRPSKEATVTITARTTSPSIKVNSTKLTINTSATMEYYNSSTAMWIDCDGVVAIEDIVPSVLYQNGAKNVTLMVRRAATEKDTFSQTVYLTIPGQSASPSIGDSSNDVTNYYMNGKLIVQFNKASTSNIYEYTISKPGSTFTISSTSWKTVTTSKSLSLSSSLAPEGSVIYVRKKGIDANTSKNIDLKLSSAVNHFAVKY